MTSQTDRARRSSDNMPASDEPRWFLHCTVSLIVHRASRYKLCIAGVRDKSEVNPREPEFVIHIK